MSMNQTMNKNKRLESNESFNTAKSYITDKSSGRKSLSLYGTMNLAKKSDSLKNK